MTGAESAPNEGAWAGSEVAYATAYRSMLRLAYTLTGSSAAAEDVVHDVFVSAGPRFSTLREPMPYLHRSVVNRCNSLHRQAARRRNKPLPPDEAVWLDPGLTELRHALDVLPPKRRAAIVLRYLCDLSDDDIAAALNCRRATVRTLVFRGLAELREVMK